MTRKTKVGIIVPCYNDQEVVETTVKTLLELLETYTKEDLVSADSFLGLVDDRSNDSTWDMIKELARMHSQIKAIRLSANRGHQYALVAGLLEFNSQADCLVSIDADLQDDVQVIGEMIKRFQDGNEIVYGVRKSRYSDSVFKRVSALTFHRILKVFNKEAILNHSDFRLISQRVLDEFSNYTEVNLYLRGLFPSMGFSTAIVYYDRKRRMTGKTKYPVTKMLSLALDGIASFSVVPLRFITIIGFLVFFICVLLMIYALAAFINNKTIPGWFSTVLPFYFLGGVQILCIGIIGEYLGKIYKEVKRRPRYLVDERLQ
ncbi:MAG TPA: glycosyltransferase family 2 protein [Bacteroidales bacterium]|nr:glycosyltransferase family 2 protein [Bacteroidales bacterium]